MASSSSPFSSSSCINYEVFLSFRGEDTRETFTSHLFYALCQKKVKTFMDEDIEKGEKISADLLSAIIEGSKISVIVFSEHYADSRWCLDELIKVLECKKLNSQIVVPVFYRVHPSDVRKQKGSFGKSFGENEKRFQKMPEKVQNWRDALTEVSYLSGHESTKFRNDAILVDIIVKDVLKKLEDLTISTDFSGLVGIHSRIEKVKSLLCIESSDSQIVGIWGMGGIGKTTLAKIIFKKHSSDFVGKIFVENVREKLEKGVGLELLQKEILSELLDEKNVKSGPNIPQYTNKRLQRMRLLIVLDDVSKLEQLEYLVGGLDQFGRGSKIIITTRDREVLLEFGIDNIYEFEVFNTNEALKIFCNHAFKQNPCFEDFLELSKKAVDYAKGNALALKVLGCYFHGKNQIDWEKGLCNLSQISSSSIHNMLKISYNELHLDEKSIFLDIACFFKGEDKDWVMDILGDDRVIVDYRLNVLVDKSLISRLKDNKLQMHDLLQEMGREIVRQESIKDPGKRSRLWQYKDVYDVLKKNKGTDSIEGIFLDMSNIRDLDLTPGAFAKMSNLRLLKIYVPHHVDISNMGSKVHLLKALAYLPDELRYLHWHGYPWRTLPMNFNPENLIELNLPYSKVEQLWEGKKEASKLKIIDLHHSDYFSRIPDPVETPNLERIIVSYCNKLSCLPSSIQNFNNLRLLSFKGFTGLSCFPNNIQFRSLIDIDLSDCINLTKFPSITGNVMTLTLCRTAIEEVPSSIQRLTSLTKLNLGGCKRLTFLSTSICKLKSLYRLDLGYCSKFENFPEILEQMESLEYINLGSTKIKELPSSIELLTGLTKLEFDFCSELGNLPTNLGKLKSLKFIQGNHSAISQLPSSFKDLKKLEEADFSSCRGLVLPPLSSFSDLRNLVLAGTRVRKIPQDIGCLSSLESLDLSKNNFKNLPASIKQLSRLKELNLDGCSMLESLPEMPRSLSHLTAVNCKRLESLPGLPECPEILDASLLEKLYQSSDAFSSKVIEYKVRACPKLKKKAKDILSDSQLRIQHMAVASLYEKIPVGFRIFLSGSAIDIPEWFSNRRSGSSIIIQLPPHCSKTNLIGFAFCVVFGFEEDFDGRGQLFSIDRDYLSEINSRTWTFSSLADWNEVVLGFDPSTNVKLCCIEDHITVSYDFSVHCYITKGLSPEVKCCGVCPVYSHPSETPPNTFTVNMVPPTEEEIKSHSEFHDKVGMSEASESHGSSDDQEVEPSHKRICAEQQSCFSSQIFQRRIFSFAFLIIFVLLLFILSSIPVRTLALI
ncbi:putative disease resistance protein (TIR-NBS-LRR class) [Melia azedarach]|uniref:Disease resistance protein (TIR-NBS-LRR class) n=1 Tax=Melia azedarach TaxID=155640 RepID=A0ACC1YK22_MELAZ|nr:putative disease resistance protein (TIR-NBS-LRR class) [Melia azedarach]